MRKTIIIAIQKENQTKNIYYLTLLDNLLLILFKFHFILNKISMKYNENVIKKRNIESSLLNFVKNPFFLRTNRSMIIKRFVTRFLINRRTDG